MAKRTKKRVAPKTKARDRSLWLYLLILLLCAGIVWMITLPDDAIEEPVKEPVARVAEFDLNKVIASLETKFSLPEGGISRKKSRGVEQLTLPVDRGKMDLSYANFIVKGVFETHGANLSSGRVEGGKQVLSFSRGEDEFLVNLVYAAPAARKASSPKYIAIVVDDFGSVSGEMLQQWLELPTEVCFAIISRLKHSEETMNLANAQGRETLVHVPMEPIDYPRQNPGQDPILVQMDQARVEKTLLRHINSLPLCMGINNHMGSLATTDSDIMGWVMGVLKKKGKSFLDSRTSTVSIAYQEAQKARVPAYRNDLFLDSPNISDANLETRLGLVQELGQRKNTVVVISHCHNAEKLEYLKKFISRVKTLGFTLIPLSRVGKTDVPQIL
ncbi:MAG TPA: divergent polysaccharide deacetylase family protein [Candidatus Syntrophosphaera sp.]|jgi:hypothetical protein|nr:divergent polysaccharide deacetylase family protein [Candidatus Cloacimonadota bacterium]OQB91435.1 MAG: Divergent polysaccharide deacetylase [Candidatus Cloacimonetes bacterium ADurb.Bin117]HNU54652.1 divergent polysaccharide deacetylase family protein [Candidatus Syntrophosphaera sp.]HOG31723.1 divergent polysaccharide deacetylase family protein [Candidatus Cloacimonadota bacterium]HOH48879.1 divergent polysaccharide deacetylase family protein [Candidatus Syntrophosphaera sp.]